VANSIGDGQVRPDAPGVLPVVFELVVKDVCGDVERGLLKGAQLAKQEVCEGLLEVERTGRQSCRAANGRVGSRRGNVGCIERVQAVVEAG